MQYGGKDDAPLELAGALRSLNASEPEGDQTPQKQDEVPEADTIGGPWCSDPQKKNSCHAVILRAMR